MRMLSFLMEKDLSSSQAFCIIVHLTIFSLVVRSCKNKNDNICWVVVPHVRCTVRVFLSFDASNGCK